MREEFVEMKYFETYYYTNIVHNVLDDTMSYLRNLHNWHEDQEAWLFLQPFPKRSVLHEFAQFIIEELMYERIGEVTLEAVLRGPKNKLWVDQALMRHGIESSGFLHWLNENTVLLEDVTEDHIFDYHQDLRLTGQLDELFTRLSNEVFFILFGNRTLLAKLNGYVSGVVQGIEKAGLEPEHFALLARDGVPARVHIPEWVRRAVFFRDRGMCAACNKDLSGLVSVSTHKHFDHIVPLAEGGINDVTNMQLLCEACNLAKGRKLVTTSSRYEGWYT